MADEVILEYLHMEIVNYIYRSSEKPDQVNMFCCCYYYYTKGYFIMPVVFIVVEHWTQLSSTCSINISFNLYIGQLIVNLPIDSKEKCKK